MIINYSSKKMEKVLTNLRRIKKEYGKDRINISNRLSQLEAAKHLGMIPEVPPPRRHKLVGKYEGCWGIHISKNYRIIIEPTGTFDLHNLTTITEIVIRKLEDYH